MTRGRSDERRDGRIGARDDVGLSEPNDGVVENERRERFGFAPFRRASRDARPYQTGCRDAIAKSVVGVFDGGLVVGDSGNKATEGIVSVDCCKNSSLETAALFADGLGEKILVTLGEARRAGRLAIDCTRPASAIGGDAVGVKFGSDGGAGDGERVTRGSAGGDAS